MDAIVNIQTRRSIRKFLPDAVPQADIEAIVTLASLAPSWGNTQCVRYVAIAGGEQKEKLVAAMNREGNKNSVAMAPVTFVLCAVLGKAGRLGGGANPKGEAWTYFDCGGAAQTLCLAAHALGYGSVQIGAFDYDAVAQVINLPQGMEVVELISVGKPDVRPNQPPRLPLEELLQMDGY